MGRAGVVGGCGGVVRHPGRCALGGCLHGHELFDPAEDVHGLLLFDLFVCLANVEQRCLSLVFWLLLARGEGSFVPCRCFLIYIVDCVQQGFYGAVLFFSCLQASELCILHMDGVYLDFAILAVGLYPGARCLSQELYCFEEPSDAGYGLWAMGYGHENSSEHEMRKLLARDVMMYTFSIFVCGFLVFPCISLFVFFIFFHLFEMGDI